MSNIIIIGNQPNSKITAFGDDSKFKKTSAFAYVIFENSKLEIARRSLLDIKEKYKIPPNVLLHMRLLNNEFYRNKNGIQHLTGTIMTKFLSDIIDDMNKIPFLIKGCCFSGELPKDIDDEELGVVWSDKAIQSMLAKAALIPLGLEKYEYKDLRIVISQDSTKVRFLGKNKRQAARWTRGFSAIGAPSGYVYEFDPLIQDPTEEVLLQLADAVVYMIAHAFGNGKKSIDYRVMLEKVRNIDIHPISWSP